jgi:hypothetical protein
LPIDFDVEFNGKYVGNTPSGDDIIEWNVDQTVNRDISVSGVSAHLDDIKGDVLTIGRKRLPRTSGNGCDGAPRSYGVNLETVPGNTLTLHVSLLGLGTNIEARSISFVASAGDHFSFNITIRPVLDECGIGGGRQLFWVEVDNLAPGDVVTYNWSVAGAPILGATDQSDVTVDLTNTPTPIELAVTITVNGVEQTSTLVFQADTEESTRAKLLKCRMKKFLHINLFFNPLWDPLRDIVVRPFSRTELQTISRFADGLQNLVNELLSASGETSERR